MKHRITVETIHAGQVKPYRETIHEYRILVEVDYEGLVGRTGWGPPDKWGAHPEPGQTLSHVENLLLQHLRALHPGAVIPQLQPDRVKAWFDTWLKEWDWDPVAGVAHALFYKEYDD